MDNDKKKTNLDRIAGVVMGLIEFGILAMASVGVALSIKCIIE